MKPSEGRKRVVIEEIQPVVNAGRYPAKRVLGDKVDVTAGIFSDGHDHVGARLLFRHDSERTWQAQSSTFKELGNDLWTASFVVDRIGLWHFAIEAWVDHFDTWLSDLEKRLGAQRDSDQNIPLALNIGANHLDTIAARAKGDEKKLLKDAGNSLRALADAKQEFYDQTVAELVPANVVQLALQFC